MGEQKRWTRYEYPWDELTKVGDSFEIPEDKKLTGRQLIYAANKKALNGVRYKHEQGRVVRIA